MLIAAVAIPISICAISLVKGSGFALPNTLLALAMTAILFITHRANIKRLVTGTESRIFSNKDKGGSGNG